MKTLKKWYTSMQMLWAILILWIIIVFLLSTNSSRSIQIAKDYWTMNSLYTNNDPCSTYYKEHYVQDWNSNSIERDWKCELKITNKETGEIKTVIKNKSEVIKDNNICWKYWKDNFDTKNSNYFEDKNVCKITIQEKDWFSVKNITKETIFNNIPASTNKTEICNSLNSEIFNETSKIKETNDQCVIFESNLGIENIFYIYKKDISVFKK